MSNIFDFSLVYPIVGSWLNYARQWNEVSAGCFFLVFRLLIKNKNVTLQIIIILTVIISLYSDESN